MLRTSFATILRTLARHRVEFIVVGGVSAGLHGLSLQTQDVDIVHSRETGNIARLRAALDEMDAIYRMMPSRRLAPPESALVGPGHQLLITRHGPLDVLGAIGENLDYEQLLPHSEEMQLGDGLVMKVLDLPTLIEVKRQAGRAKDMWAVELLKAVLEEKQRLARGSGQ